MSDHRSTRLRAASTPAFTRPSTRTLGAGDPLRAAGPSGRRMKEAARRRHRPAAARAGPVEHRRRRSALRLPRRLRRLQPAHARSPPDGLRARALQAPPPGDHGVPGGLRLGGGLHLHADAHLRGQGAAAHRAREPERRLVQGSDRAGQVHHRLLPDAVQDPAEPRAGEAHARGTESLEPQGVRREGRGRGRVEPADVGRHRRQRRLRQERATAGRTAATPARLPPLRRPSPRLPYR